MLSANYFVSVFCHLCLINRDELVPEVRVTSGFRSGVNEIFALFGSPIFKVQEVLDCLTLVQISDRLSRNVGDYTNLRRATSHKSEGFWQQNTFEAWLELSMLSFQRLKCGIRMLIGQSKQNDDWRCLSSGYVVALVANRILTCRRKCLKCPIRRFDPWRWIHYVASRCLESFIHWRSVISQNKGILNK